jgi:hypothetical protein
MRADRFKLLKDNQVRRNDEVNALHDEYEASIVGVNMYIYVHIRICMYLYVYVNMYIMYKCMNIYIGIYFYV